jgi:hypothetical protein
MHLRYPRPPFPFTPRASSTSSPEEPENFTENAHGDRRARGLCALENMSQSTATAAPATDNRHELFSPPGCTEPPQLPAQQTKRCGANGLAGGATTKHEQGRRSGTERTTEGSERKWPRVRRCDCAEVCTSLTLLKAQHRPATRTGGLDYKRLGGAVAAEPAAAGLLRVGRGRGRLPVRVRGALVRFRDRVRKNLRHGSACGNA